MSPARLLFRDPEGSVIGEAPGAIEGELLPRVTWYGRSTAARSVENADSITLHAFRIDFKPAANPSTDRG